MLRSQCCRRHRRKIQTIARLSSPVVIASVPFVESRRCHRNEERESSHHSQPRDASVRGGVREEEATHQGNNERRRRRRRVCRSRLGSRCCNRCSTRRLRYSTTNRLAPFCCSRPKRGGIFTSREELRARRALVSFVLFLPEDDDSYDLLLPFYETWLRWITT